MARTETPKKPDACQGCGCRSGVVFVLEEKNFCEYCYERRLKGVPPEGWKVELLGQNRIEINLPHKESI